MSSIHEVNLPLVIGTCKLSGLPREERNSGNQKVAPINDLRTSSPLTPSAPSDLKSPTSTFRLNEEQCSFAPRLPKVKSTGRNAKMLLFAMLTFIMESVLLAGAIFRMSVQRRIEKRGGLMTVHPLRDVNEAFPCLKRNTMTVARRLRQVPALATLGSD